MIVPQHLCISTSNSSICSLLTKPVDARGEGVTATPTVGILRVDIRLAVKASVDRAVLWGVLCGVRVFIWGRHDGGRQR